MSGTANEYDKPGGNYPDREGGTLEPEAAEQRSDAGVGGPIHQEGVDAADTSTQDEPLLEQNDATTQEKVDGIIAQTRADLGDESAERFAEVLHQRFDDAGMQLTDEQIRGLADGASGTA
jgi:hypothetical protein